MSENFGNQWYIRQSGRSPAVRDSSGFNQDHLSGIHFRDFDTLLSLPVSGSFGVDCKDVWEEKI